MKITRFTFCILLAALVWTGGCIIHGPNPIEGWKACEIKDAKTFKMALLNDYQDYIQKLPPEERRYIWADSIAIHEDGTGKHAIIITVNLNGTRWAHVLIYNKENKRIKVIKYASGSYQS